MGKRLFKHILIYLCITTILILLASSINMYRSDEEVSFEGDGCLVISYHRIIPSNRIINILYGALVRYSDDNEITLYSITRHEFMDQLAFFKKHNIRILSLDEFHRYIDGDLVVPGKSVLLTFDDVDISVYKNAYDLMSKDNIPFVIFPISGNVGNSDFSGLHLCTWEQLNEMKDSGLAAMGSHTHNLHYMDKVYKPPLLYRKNVDQFKSDLLLSIDSFKEHSNVDIESFCYPYGDSIKETDRVVKEAGIPLIFTLGEEIIQSNHKGATIDRLLLTRYNWYLVVEWISNS